MMENVKVKNQTFKLVLKSWGGVKHDFMTGLTMEKAEEIAESYNWQWSEDGGYIWDIWIEEED